MDSNFFKFWEKFVQQAVKEQISSPDLMNMLQQGAGGSDDIMDMFKKYYGLDQMSVEAPDYSELYEESLQHFTKSLNHLFSIMDVVPKKDYLDLEKKYKILEKKAAELEEVIMHLKLLLKTGSTEVEEGIGPLNKMLKTQNEHFLKMMDSLAGFYGVSKDKDQEE